MNEAEEMERDELKRFRYNLISKLKERKLGAMVFCICLCYILLRLPLTIIGNESIHYWNFKFAFCMFLYNLQFTIHSVIYPIGGKDFAICYLDMLKKIFPCCCHIHSTNANMSFHQKCTVYLKRNTSRNNTSRNTSRSTSSDGKMSL